MKEKGILGRTERACKNLGADGGEGSGVPSVVFNRKKEAFWNG